MILEEDWEAAKKVNQVRLPICGKYVVLEIDICMDFYISIIFHLDWPFGYGLGTAMVGSSCSLSSEVKDPVPESDMIMCTC